MQKVDEYDDYVVMELTSSPKNIILQCSASSNSKNKIAKPANNMRLIR